MSANGRIPATAIFTGVHSGIEGLKILFQSGAFFFRCSSVTGWCFMGVVNVTFERNLSPYEWWAFPVNFAALD